MPDGSAGVRARIQMLCRTSSDSRQLRAAVLAEIDRVVPFDSYAWLLTDPETRVGWSPLARVPELAQLPLLIRLKYTTRVNRWTSLPPNRCATLASATGGELGQSRMWLELLKQYSVTDVASVVFADQFGCWGFLDLWRHGASTARFHAPEQHFLSTIAPELTAALRSCQAATFTGPATVGTIEGASVLLLSPRLELLDQTPQSDTHLRQLLPTDVDASPVPAAAYNVAAQLLAIQDAVDDGPAQARSHLAGTQWLTLRAARLAGHGDERQQMIAVTVEAARPRDRVELFGRAHGLTGREREVLHRLTRGVSTRQLATEMDLSPRTVPDHLKSIFLKTNMNSRGTLVARALGAEKTTP